MRFAHLLTAILLCEAPALGADSATVRLADKGKVLAPVVVSAKASERVRRAAKTLADYLGRMSGAAFTVETGDGQSGIAVGLPRDFPELGLEKAWDVKDATRRDDYLLRSHGKGLHVIGASDLGVENAVWDLLYRLGHRHFFPGPTWEIVPRNSDLAISVDVREHPAYLTRELGYGYGPWEKRGDQYFEWCARNRMSGMADRPLLESGHAYHRIHADRKDEFAKHPEYFALVGGKRVDTGEIKFCIGNPELRKLVARYAVDHFSRNRDSASLSLEASDGLGWCECERCRALGSVSDCVATLVNEAAVAVRAKHGPKKLISIYAYAEHAPPPRVKVDAQVVASVATSMTLGDFTTDGLVTGWRKQGAQLGIREYYGVYPWDHDLPGQPLPADLGYLKRTIPGFHREGARFLVAESSDSWAVSGLGYYLIARMLWDVREAERIDSLKADFLDKAFGSARAPLAEFYRLIEAASKPRLSSDLLGRMYRTLEEGLKKSPDPATAARIRELILYVRYVELYYDYAFAEGAERQRAFEALLRYAYRMRGTGMVHSLAVWRGLPYEDRSVRLPAGVAYDAPAEKNAWMDRTPIADKEVQQMLVAGIARFRVSDIKAVSFGTDLVPAAPLKLPATPAGNAGMYYRDKSAFYAWTDKPMSELALTVKGGLIYQNVGPAKFTLSAGAAKEQTTIPPDQKEHAVRLPARTAGLHRLEMSDRTGGTALTWPVGARCVIPAGPNEATYPHGRFTLYFYVPRGTKTVAGYAEGVGTLHDGAGKTVFTFTNRPDYFSVPVAEGQDGRLWQFANSLGRRVLLTVPPYLARDARELLLPAEVVRADTPK